MRKPIPRRGVAALLAAASALLGVSLLSQSNVETAGATNYDQATSGDVTNCAFPNDYLTDTNGSGTDGTSNHQEHDINAWKITMELQDGGVGAFAEVANNTQVQPGDVVRFKYELTDTTFGL